MSKGKKYREAAAKYDRQELYDLKKAVELVKELSFAKFDETIEVAMKLEVKAKHSIRDTLVLPYTFRGRLCGRQRSH